MEKLGIDTIFDLRSDTEIIKYGTSSEAIKSSLPSHMRIIHAPVFKTEDYSPEMMAQ